MRTVRRCARVVLMLTLMGGTVLPLSGCVAAWPILVARRLL